VSRAARDWAWARRELIPALRLVLLALAEHADAQGACWPSLSRLAQLAELDRRTVTRALAELAERGLIERERPASGTTRYRLVLGEPGQGRETPRGERPLGASGPQGRGVRPLGRGERPPDLGVSRPPNRHKNRQ